MVDAVGVAVRRLRIITSVAQYYHAASLNHDYRPCVTVDPVTLHTHNHQRRLQISVNTCSSTAMYYGRRLGCVCVSSREVQWYARGIKRWTPPTIRTDIQILAVFSSRAIYSGILGKPFIFQYGIT